MRIALSGASGTGKTTLAKYLSEKYHLPINPVGAREVAATMGFASPYDVDKAGKRAEFQKRLVLEKRAWETEHSRFVTDRTTIDNLTYTILHDVKSVDEKFFELAVGGLHRYTHVVFFPIDRFIKTGDDPSRVHDLTYHRIFERILDTFIRQYQPDHTVHHALRATTVEGRRHEVDYLIVQARL